MGAAGWGGERAGRLALGTGGYLWYIVIRYIGEFSAAFLYRNPQKPRKKRIQKKAMRLMRYSKYAGARG